MRHHKLSGYSYWHSYYHSILLGVHSAPFLALKAVYWKKALWRKGRREHWHWRTKAEFFDTKYQSWRSQNDLEILSAKWIQSVAFSVLCSMIWLKAINKKTSSAKVRRFSVPVCPYNSSLSWSSRIGRHHLSLLLRNFRTEKNQNRTDKDPPTACSKRS